MRRIGTIIGMLIVAALMLAAIGRAGDLPAPGDIICSQGEDCQTQLTFKSNGRADNLNGYQYLAQVRAHYPDTASLASFSVDLSQASSGRVNLVLPAALTSALVGKVGVWDLRQTDPSGNVTYPVRGAFKCVWSATR
jgi:hypothetical protein